MSPTATRTLDVRPAAAPRTASNLTTRQPRVLMVVTEDWYFWSHRLNLARAIRDAGHEVAIAVPAGPLEDRIRAEGFRFFPLRLERKGRNPVGEARSVASLWRLFRRYRPDVVHLVAMKPILYGGVAARLAGVPAVVCAVAGLGYLFLPGGWRRTLGRKLIEGAYRNLLGGRRFRFILQNPDDVELFHSRGLAPAGRLELIRSAGVDTARFHPTPEPAGPPVVLTHSRMLWDKGLGELVEAARLLRQRNLEFRLCLVGDPDPANPASIPEATLREWDARGFVEWTGRRDDVPEQLAACHVACLPSYREGAPLSLAEAAAAGRPIVATDVPGCRGIVVDGDNGLLVPPRDPVALAEALARLISDPELRRAMGARSRAIAERDFSDACVAAKTLELYRRMGVAP